MTKDEAAAFAALKLARRSINNLIASSHLTDPQPWRDARQDSVAALTAIDKALAQTSTQCEKQPAQEPVGEVNRYGRDSHGRQWHGIHWYDANVDVPHGTKLYTTPQQRPWVGLTGQEIDDIDEANWEEDHKVWVIHEFARAIEAKLKEKNT